MPRDISDIIAEHTKIISDSSTLEQLDEKERALFHKKKGLFTELFAEMGSLPPEKRGELGQSLNKAKNKLQSLIDEKKITLQTSQVDDIFIDVTLPTHVALKNKSDNDLGHLHPLTSTIREIQDIFNRLGFSRQRYREIESDYYAFEALNIPREHPARNEVETFYVENDLVITPHTSSGQVHEMEKGEVPIRMINISRCARRQEDVTHLPTFYQFEGLFIDKTVSIADLKGVLTYFAHNFFGEKRSIRLRPNDFRFTEPSFEIDISCNICGGKGGSCRVCKDGWLELGGAGMVHPNVLKAGKLDPQEMTGFAFGWGVERVFMMKNPNVSLPDLRMLYKNDIRFLGQF